MDDNVEIFWEQVASEIDQKFKKNGKPLREWRKKEITFFLDEMANEVSMICEKEPEKGKKCGYDYNINYTTFRKIFRTKESKGNSYTRNIFSIYLGYDSYNDFIEQKKIYTINQNVDSYEVSLKTYYQNDLLFNAIRIPGDKEGVVGELSMKEYYIAISYIDNKDIRNRASLIQKEQESARQKIRRNAFDKRSISTDYLSIDILKHNEQIIITGNPGIGKSTYARWLCYQWASTELDVDFIPVYIQLRNLNFFIQRDVIYHSIRDSYFPDSSVSDLKKYIQGKHQNYLFIFDGFDELSYIHKNVFEEEMKVLTHPRGKAKYILLSRPYGLMNRQFNQNIILQIDGFTTSSIENYINAFLAEKKPTWR